jgi:hypothetical protein
LNIIQQLVSISAKSQGLRFNREKREDTSKGRDLPLSFVFYPLLFFPSSSLVFFYPPFLSEREWKGRKECLYKREPTCRESLNSTQCAERESLNSTRSAERESLCAAKIH